MGRVSLPRGAYIEDGLLIVGDEAWTLREWQEAHAYEHSPERKAKKAENYQRFKERNPDYHRNYNREWMRQKRAGGPRVIGALHDLACTGPTKLSGCRCRKIKVYDKPREDVA